ncbi:fumarylacetoacetase [Sphingomonas sp. 1P08PE]|uniref:fumarylacetoacetase n=1 Tax=Sphingomonas sp. 1P08PE TaxID=554122 RepID=UPI0039A20DBE
MTIDHTHDPALNSWVAGAEGHADFPVQNLPLGIFSPAGGAPRPGTAIGDHILDLGGIVALLPDAVAPTLTATTLNALFALPAAERVALRRRLSQLLSDPAHRAAVEPMLHAAADCTMHLPAAIGDYTDFYVGIHHANNVGRQFRPDQPLLPNYKWVPIGYHGRASSVRPGGVPVIRPKGQRKPPQADVPDYGPSRRLDYELEMGVWIGRGNALGDPIAIADAGAHVAGLSLLNDWSARDFQAWEYQPLGPFLAKNFHTSVSPWVVTAEALAPFRIAQPARPEGDPRPLPYLWDEADQASGAFAIELEVHLSTAAMQAAGTAPHRLSRGVASNMYWTIAQIVTHHASNGCNLAPGDLLGTGTISAPDDSGYGSLLEISRGGSQPVTLPGGETRSFLEDGDEVTLTARAVADGHVPIGFGTCSAIILPARP